MVSRVHFTKDFSIVIQIWWKIDFSVIPLQCILSLQNFVHAPTAQMLCHVQHFVTIAILQLGWKQNEISIKVELR